MSPRNWRERIQDILDAIAEIESFTLGMDYGSFRADPKTVKAVELNLIVIGEAAGQIPVEVEENSLAIDACNAQPFGPRVFFGR